MRDDSFQTDEVKSSLLDSGIPIDQQLQVIKQDHLSLNEAMAAYEADPKEVKSRMGAWNQMSSRIVSLEAIIENC